VSTLHHTMRAVLCASFLLSLAGCRDNAGREVSYQEIARQRLGKNVEFLPNADSSFMLCVQREYSRPPLIRLRFLVWDFSTGRILLQDSLMQADVFWSDPTHVRVVSSPEAPGEEVNTARGYVFDVLEGRKTTIKQ
jgi:hypothetical protein